MLRALIFFIYMSSAAYAAETVGMPQLDPKSWVPQIFWLILTFGFLYVVIAKIVYPRLSESIEQRNDYISDLVDEAKKLTEQTDKLNKQYKDFIKDSNHKAQEIIANERKKLTIEFNKKQDELNNKISQITVEAEKEINTFKLNSIDQIKVISKSLTEQFLKDLSIKELIDQNTISKKIEEISKKRKGSID